MRRLLPANRNVLVPVTVEQLEEGGFLVTSDALQGLLAEGDTVEEALDFAQDVAEKLLESRREHGVPVPDSLTPSPAHPVAAALFVPTPS